MQWKAGLIVRIHATILAAITFFYIATGTSEPTAAITDRDPERARLAALEDAFAHHPEDSALAAELMEHYLERDRPALAVAALRSGDATLLDDPVVAHRVAEAYERVGRPLEALATAKVARARCARALGSSRTGRFTPVPQHGCTESLHAALDAHVVALRYMVRWGVVLPSRDPRAATAYRMALRRARVAAQMAP